MKPDKQPKPSPTRPWVILLVDDEDDILASYQTLFESSIEHVKVITANTGRLGLDVMDRERIDLVVADFKMPGMDGVEFLYQARKKFPGVPRVMLTAFASEDLARRAFVETFVEAFLSKSLEPENLVDAIRSKLNYEPGGSGQTIAKANRGAAKGAVKKSEG